MNQQTLQRLYARYGEDRVQTAAMNLVIHGRPVTPSNLDQECGNIKTPRYRYAEVSLGGQEVISPAEPGYTLHCGLTRAYPED